MVRKEHRNGTQYKNNVKCRFLETVGIKNDRKTDDRKSKTICLVFGVLAVHQVIIETGKQDRSNESETEIHKSFSYKKYKKCPDCEEKTSRDQVYRERIITGYYRALGRKDVVKGEDIIIPYGT